MSSCLRRTQHPLIMCAALLIVLSGCDDKRAAVVPDQPTTAPTPTEPATVDHDHDHDHAGHDHDHDHAGHDHAGHDHAAHDHDHAGHDHAHGSTSTIIKPPSATRRSQGSSRPNKLLPPPDTTTAPTSQPRRRPSLSPPSATREAAALDRVYTVEAAHGIKAWDAQPAIRLRFDFKDHINDRDLHGTLLLETKTGRTRIETDDGVTLLFDGTTAWAVRPDDMPADAVLPDARYHTHAWSYILAMPFKLRDHGTKLSVHQFVVEVHDTLCDTLNVKFDSVAGDTPEDSYVAAIEPRSNLMQCVSYLSTYGRTRAVANTEGARSFVFDDFVTIDGVTLATTWRERGWHAEFGPRDDVTAEARLTELEFVEPASDAFTAPPGAEPAEPPATK